ncbi:MAG: plasmid encoded RepA protein, partial [Bryobacterales bacterium]|nr:plasmid encoded RepA protein [Bryobacterales bacterium]
YMWLSWRCFKSPGVEYINLCGPGSLEQQMGMTDYKRERRFKQKIREWLAVTKRFWPECPAEISPDGQYLIIQPGKAIHSAQS